MVTNTTYNISPKGFGCKLRQVNDDGDAKLTLSCERIFDTKLQARNAIDGITDELFFQMAENVRSLLIETKEEVVGLQYDFDMSNGRRGSDMREIIAKLTSVIHAVTP